MENRREKSTEAGDIFMELQELQKVEEEATLEITYGWGAVLTIICC